MVEFALLLTVVMLAWWLITSCVHMLSRRWQRQRQNLAQHQAPASPATPQDAKLQEHG